MRGRRPDWADQVRAAAPDGIDVVLDAVGGVRPGCRSASLARRAGNTSMNRIGSQVFD